MRRNRSFAGNKGASPGYYTSGAREIASAKPIHGQILANAWINFHRSTKCKFQCRNDQGHYKKWRESHFSNLQQLHDIVKTKSPNLSKVSFDEFSEFTYSCSSGKCQ
jgi:hypothetical protein